MAYRTRNGALSPQYEITNTLKGKGSSKRLVLKQFHTRWQRDTVHVQITATLIIQIWGSWGWNLKMKMEVQYEVERASDTV